MSEPVNAFGTAALGALVGLLLSPFALITVTTLSGQVGLTDAEGMQHVIAVVLVGAVLGVCLGVINQKRGSTPLKPKTKPRSDGVWDRDVDG